MPVFPGLRRVPQGAVRHLVLAGFLLGSGCLVDATGIRSSPEPEPPEEHGVRARFELVVERMSFGSIPWPDDLYLDADERISVGHLPGEVNNTFLRSLRESLGGLDGFSAVSPIFFYFDGAIDPESIDADNVFLMDFETGSPETFEKVPVTVHWYEPALQLAIRPARGHPLQAGHKYAAVVTRDVEDGQGNPIRPAEAFSEIRDADTVPDRPLSALAYNQYAPVLSGLNGQGIAHEEIVALAVFTVQSFGSDLQDARGLIEQGEIPELAVSTLLTAEALDAVLGSPAKGAVGLDASGGAPHEHIGWMAQGSFRSPYLLSRTANRHGPIERNEFGGLQVKQVGVVPFSLWLPLPLPDGSDEGLPVVIFQHGLGRERSDGLVVANELGRRGYAVFAIDAPFHGLRVSSGQSDWKNRFTLDQQPDGFGDQRGAPGEVDYQKVVDLYTGVEEAGVEAIDFNQDEAADYLHPFYWRDATRQAVLDLLGGVRLLRDGDWSALGELDGELGTLHFDATRIGFVGIDLGGQIGVLLSLAQPEVNALYLGLCGGHLAEGLVESPFLNPLFERLLGRIGVEATDVKYEQYPPIYRPELAVWQTLMDRADPLAFAPALRLLPVSILMAIALNDEVSNNMGSESLGRALNAVFASDNAAAPRYTDMRIAETPIDGNVTTGNERVTRVLFQFNRATHGLLTDREDVYRWEHPVRAPFQAVPEEAVLNPIGQALRQMGEFFHTWRDEGVPKVVPPD